MSCKKSDAHHLKLVLLAMLVIGLIATACQSNISQPLQATVSSIPLGESTPALVTPPPSSPADPQIGEFDLTVTPKVVEESQGGSGEPPALTGNLATVAASYARISSPTPISPIYYVSMTGDDQSGNGSVGQPFATIGRALESAQDGATIIVQRGTYSGQLSLTRRFAQGVTIQSEEAYEAQLRHNETVVACYYCQGITLTGFDIAHTGEGAGRYVIQIQDLSDDRSGGRRVTLRNNIIHDSRNNDLLKINNGADDITVTGNMLYNMGGPGLDSMIDVNSATNVIIQDNVFFNDFAASNRSQNNDTGSFIVIKDSNGDQDSNLGSNSITVRRNIFLNWQGDPHNAFLVIGEDDVDYFQAENVLIENNLMLGNSNNPMRAALHIRGSRDIIFRNNTVTGDLPSRSYATRLSRADPNPPNEGIYFHNNIWSDPTGTMGVSAETNDILFAQVNPADASAVQLQNNLYWNGQAPIPWDENQLINYTDDLQRIVADPGLPDLKGILIPYWLVEEGRFAGGALTIEDAFRQLVMAYGATAVSSSAIDAAAIEFAAEEDILGNPRSVPDIGAYEYQPPQD